QRGDNLREGRRGIYGLSNAPLGGSTMSGHQNSKCRRFRIHGYFAAMVCLVAPQSASTQNLDFNKVEIFVEQNAPNFYSFTASRNMDPLHPDGAGGRIGV